ncbi:MAG: radical SAM protein [Candidatus Omnitrophica bacterium]|nr:radical SAM protein [Candidatus Omnitrophota bacterium]
MSLKILLINVSLRPEAKVRLFPVGLGYIATAMKNAGYAFDLIDIDGHRLSQQQVENNLKKKKYDVVCMGCIVTGYKIIKSLSQTVRQYQPGAKIIAGNSVATSIVQTLLSRTDVDIAVMGEGDETIIELLRAIDKDTPLEAVRGICFTRNGQIARNEPRPYIKDISSMPLLDFSIFDIEVYIENSKNSVSDPLPILREKIRALPVNTARGCISHCTFCYHNFLGLPYRYRSAKSIVAEIKHSLETYRLNYIHFWDELTFYSKKQTLELVQEILDQNLKFYWAATCRANLFDDKKDMEIIYKMKEAGCLGMAYSLESANPRILKAMNKHITTAQFTKQTRLFHKAGLPTWTSLVFGYPQETPATIKATFDCCIKNKMYPSAGYLLPQPGSVMYDYALRHGFIDDEEEYLEKLGDRQDLRLNITGMPDLKFESLITQGLKRCNEKLKLGLKQKELIKSQYYRAQKKGNS